MIMTVTAVLSFSSCKKAEKYEIVVACQSEDAEKSVLTLLKEAYEKKNPEVQITIKSFTGKDFENYMLGIAQNRKGSPHIIWTSDSYHVRWDKYFVDLRPYYEASEETYYDNYYTSMLHTSATNGEFKPTKNYKGTWSGELDTADGHEQYGSQSEFGIYYAPRDYNKPAVICNLALFDMLDKQYAKYFGAPEKTTTQRLNEIVAGTDWDDINDLFTFAKIVAERINAIVDKATEKIENGDFTSDDVDAESFWKVKTALDLKLSWEPSYMTILTALGVDNVVKSDGSLNVQENQAVLQSLHDKLYAVNRLCYSDVDDTNFGSGYTMMKVVSRPVIMAYAEKFGKLYAEYDSTLQTIKIPTRAIAAGNSGYAINNYYANQKAKSKFGQKGYLELCWDFIKFIITKEGQEVAGASGSNIPVLKSLYDKNSNGGKEPAWRQVASMQGMNHNAWVEGEELKQDWFNIYEATLRDGLKSKFESFFRSFQKQNYNEGSLSALILNLEDAWPSDYEDYLKK